ADDRQSRRVAARHDEGAGRRRVVGIADVDRYSSVEDRFECFVVENRKAGVREFAHFAVRDLLDLDWPLDEPWIDDEYAVDVGEVLVDLGVDRGSENRTGDVRTAARKRDDAPRFGIAEEARKNADARLLAEMGAEPAVRRLQHTRVARLVRKQHARVVRI